MIRKLQGIQHRNNSKRVTNTPGHIVIGILRGQFIRTQQNQFSDIEYPRIDLESIKNYNSTHGHLTVYQNRSIITE